MQKSDKNTKKDEGSKEEARQEAEVKKKVLSNVHKHSLPGGDQAPRQGQKLSHGALLRSFTLATLFQVREIRSQMVAARRQHEVDVQKFVTCWAQIGEPSHHNLHAKREKKIMKVYSTPTEIGD